MNTKFKIGVVVAVIFGAIGLIWKAFDSISYGGNFVLNHNETEWQYNQNPKKLNLIYFGFTKCESICPMTLSASSKAFYKLNHKELKIIRFIFVSVDYQHDKPQKVSQYAMSFFPEFIGLIGNKQQIDKAVKLFPAGYIMEDNPDSQIAYTITHTDKIFFADEQGKMIDYISSPRNSDEILTKIRKYL